MKPPKFQHPLRHRPYLLLLLLLRSTLCLLSSFSLLYISLYPAALFPRSKALLLFFRLCRWADALAISRQRSRVGRRPRTLIRETRGASAGVAMTQSQPEPMDWLLHRRCSVSYDWAWPRLGVRFEGVLPPLQQQQPASAWGNAEVCPGV